MNDFLNKCDFKLCFLYKEYQELQQRAREQGEEFPERSDKYELSLRYEGSLEEIEARGFKTSWDGKRGFAHGEIHLDDLEAIASHDNVFRIEYGEELEIMLDESAPDIKARAKAVSDISSKGIWHVDNSSGVIATGSKATGKGVVVGIIDTGIDITHPVFLANKLLPKRSRILSIWDQGLTPTGAEKGPDKALLLVNDTYGVEFDNNAIDTYINSTMAVDFRHKDCVGHGTHVASTAAGNGDPGEYSRLLFKDGFDYVGVAPEADIIVVKFIDVTNPMDPTDKIRFKTSGTPVRNRIRHAIMYIINSAKKIAPTKPVVINMSLGSALGPHDGLTEDEQWISDQFSATNPLRKGNVVVVAAGNSAGTDQHSKITIPAGSEIIVPFKLVDTRGARIKNYIKCVSTDYVPALLIDLWYKNVPGVQVAMKPKSNPTFHADFGIDPALKGPFFFDAFNQWYIQHRTEEGKRPNTARPNDKVKRNHARFIVYPSTGLTPKHKAGVYEIRIKGPVGTEIHAWTRQPIWNKKKNIKLGFVVTDKLADGTALSGAVLSKIVKTDSNLIGIPAGAENVITVAAYDDAGGKETASNYANIYSSSSRGPLMDYSGLGPYTDKPDIAAPGLRVKAAESKHSGGFTSTFFNRLLGYWFKDMNGTSMAAPHVAGMIALMLQKKPDLSVHDVKSILSVAANVRPGKKPVPTDVDPYKDAFGKGMVDVVKEYDKT